MLLDLVQCIVVRLSQPCDSHSSVTIAMRSDATANELASAEAHQVLHELREASSVTWISDLGCWLVTNRSHALEVLRNAETFTVDDERFSTGQVVGPSMLTSDGAAHARQRMPFARAFGARSVRGWEPHVESIANSLVAWIAPDGGADLGAELARPLAVETIIYALELTDTDADELSAWYSAIARGVDVVSNGFRLPKPSLDAMNALRKRILASARQPDSVLGTIGKDLSDAELASNAAVVLFGAIETSEAMTANALWFALNTPGAFGRLTDRTLIDVAIEESLRLEPGAAVVDRYATHNVKLAHADIKRGDLVRVSLAAANRDPAVFDDPDRFDLGRTNAGDHLGFVQGPHACLGARLARVQTRAAMHACLNRLPDLALDHDAAPPTGLIFRKPERLTTTWRLQ